MAGRGGERKGKIERQEIGGRPKYLGEMRKEKIIVWEKLRLWGRVYIGSPCGFRIR